MRKAVRPKTQGRFTTLNSESQIKLHMLELDHILSAHNERGNSIRCEPAAIRDVGLQRCILACRCIDSDGHSGQCFA
jgi:hypothetical protein